MQVWAWVTSRILTVRLSLEIELLNYSPGRKWRQRDLILTKLVEGRIQINFSNIGEANAAGAGKTEPLVVEPVINLDDNYRIGKAIIYAASDHPLYQLNKLRVIILFRQNFHGSLTRSTLIARRCLPRIYCNAKTAAKVGSRSSLIEVVGTTGFEPATSRTPSVRATRLRHVPFYLTLLQRFAICHSRFSTRLLFEQRQQLSQLRCELF